MEMKKKAGYYLIVGFGLLFGVFLLGKDMISFLQWYLMVLVIGIIFLPLTNILFSRFSDKGYLFSKILGIAVSGFLMWLLSSFYILPFVGMSCFIIIVLACGFNLILYKSNNKANDNMAYPNMDSEKKSYENELIIKEEFIFFISFLILSYIRGSHPQFFYGERYMDFGIVKSLMRNEFMPPEDFWFSGSKLNYYYFGHFITAFLTKLSFVEVEIAFNLMTSLLGVFIFTLSFSIGFQIIRSFQEGKDDTRRWISWIGGIISGLAVAFAGNMHYTIFRWVLPILQKINLFTNITYEYEYTSSTRYIGYFPDVKDKTIHEFPSFSIIMGDLHAHAANVMFVLALLGILLSWLLEEKEVLHKSKIKEMLNPNIIGITFFLAIFQISNFWDFPIYYVVCGAVILFSNIRVYKNRSAMILTACQGVLIFGGTKLLIMPFLIEFYKMASGIKIANNHTVFYQLLILWGLPIGVFINYFIVVIRKYIHKPRIEKSDKEVEVRVDIENEEVNGFIIKKLLYSLKTEELWIITIGLCALGLILLPEIVYVDDIISDEYVRANTMFKLTYQAFIIFGLCFGYIFVQMFFYVQNKIHKIFAMIGFVLFLTTLGYYLNGIYTNSGNIFNKNNYIGLYEITYVHQLFHEDRMAVEWINKNLEGNATILEADGESFTLHQRISTFTGFPTVLGWIQHEMLWKSGYGTEEEVARFLSHRSEDIKSIYTSNDLEQVKELIDKYKIEYIYVGRLEYDKYMDINHDILSQVGRIVLEVLPLEGKDYRTYLLKVSEVS